MTNKLQADNVAATLTTDCPTAAAAAPVSMPAASASWRI